ncbi:electron transfer flavoprotein subunit beta/FixA family protein [Stygiolobus caldivivus]|uniref:Electron transfer flavoprotein subunit alpha n=1 Tax=Stygiolobus caldivivus TaxID=2824673 RepID=A0A8D5U7P1_9CREN|nr:electron transfer flavoprotein subunit beta/FixA family protein [Stygiolobus caldivivus]BCU70326.1 electron transfer flavoprotein subunit alpha [Stygiolobus caldivivus]
MSSVIALFKIVPDDTLIRITQTGLDLNVPYKISTYDKNAIEEAVRMKEKYSLKAMGITAGVTDRKSIREALAMGLDEVVAIEMREMDIQTTAENIAEQVKGLSPKLIIGGETTTDSSGGVFIPYLASLLNYPIITYVKSLTLIEDKVRAERNLTSFTQTVESELPAIVSVVGEINTPRIPGVKQILESQKKPVKTINSTAIPKVKITAITPYTIQRKKVVIEGKMDEAVDKLLQYLKGEGVL